ncbi:hypothetical protein IPC1236_18435 [Pseudomonas aeruginosa]|uniref:hypothetical protein n=1 Tax=Pseudomonas aeruginosa TaxID=287 RepID=UPI000FD2475A|nr:hypothetical protein [Pseudomonas aeruginosa]RUE47720.1 hypothetical protein IPC1236_18435 [Pseudomonas aeruginosa]
MSENEKPLKWLRKQDGEWEWAAEYLKDRLTARERDSLSSDAFTQFSTYEHTASSIRQIQKTRPELIIKLQGAIRQRRYRSDSNGKKPLTFSLNKETITKLNSIAKQNNADATAVISALIGKEGAAVESEKDYKKQLRESVARVEKISVQAVASMTTQRDEALKYAERYLKLLAQWELAHPNEAPPSASAEDIAKFVEPRLKDLRAAIDYVAFRDSVLTERVP